VTAQRVTVPVPAETGVEDRLAGSLTFRHAAYLAVAAAGVAVMLLGERSPVRVVLGALVAIVGVAGAAVRPYGEPLDRLLPAAVAYLRRHRAERRATSPAEAEAEVEVEPEPDPEPVPVPEPTGETDQVDEHVAPRPRRLIPFRALLIGAPLAAVVAVAVARWPHPAPAPPVQVVVVPVEVVDPWEEAIDDAVDAWLDDIRGT
jgi:hypothetical protein